MVTLVKLGKALRTPFYYNEKKVSAGVAEFIHSANYGKDTDQLTRKNRLARLVKQATRNDRVKVNSVHITVNFHTNEKIAKETLQRIVDSYMNRIGFGGQPYLVYQHLDTVHPHVHIVTTLIQLDGRRIPATIPSTCPPYSSTAASTRVGSILSMAGGEF
jgi:Relaxase/Mobilisation nuclease domain